MAKVKNQLEGNVPTVRPSDIFFTPDHDILPEKVKLPCVGIKDGRIGRTDLLGGAKEASLPLEISVYDRMFLDDKAIPVLMDLATSVVAALKGNMLDDYVNDMSVGDETPVQWMFDREIFIIRKTVFFQYLREE